MVGNQQIISVYFQTLIVIGFVVVYGPAHVFDIYYGVTIGAVPMRYFTYIALFTNLAMYMFGTVEKYISGYGIYMLARFGNRKKLLKLVNNIILKKLLIYEISLSCICFSVHLIFTGNGIQAEKLASAMILTFLVSYVCLIIQALLEIVASARVGVLTTVSLYIAMLLIPDLLMMKGSSINYFLLLIPNLSMCNRIDVLPSMYFLVVFWLFFLTACLWILLLKGLKKKDIM